MYQFQRPRFIALASVVAMGFLMGATTVSAQTAGYPDRPIRLVVPYAPGGNTDVLARVAAQKLGEAIGQPVVIDNRPGANTLVGARAALAAPADGYTLLMANSVGAEKRLEALPDVPTFKEQGLPAMSNNIWYAVAVPARVPTWRTLNALGTSYHPEIKC